MNGRLCDERRDFDGNRIDEIINGNGRTDDQILFFQNGRQVEDVIDRNDNVNDDDENINGARIEDIASNDIPCRTIKTVRWLHSEGRLSVEEKKSIITDIISYVGSTKFSKAEMAFSLFICRGRPGIDLTTIPGGSYNIGDWDSEDMYEFEDVCRTIYRIT